MTNTLLGRPINGDISHYGSNPGEQRPIEELLEKLDAVFAFPEVDAIRWPQFTPYFNDGDACEFSVHDPLLRLVDGDEDAGYNGDGFIDTSGEYPPGYWDTHAEYEYDYVPRTDGWGHKYVARPLPEGKVEASWKDRRFYVNGVEREDIKEAFESFSGALQSGAYELKLREVFGDPAEVTATREGFNVEHYDHD